jgi:hypothetical protein
MIQSRIIIEHCVKGTKQIWFWRILNSVSVSVSSMTTARSILPSYKRWARSRRKHVVLHVKSSLNTSDINKDWTSSTNHRIRNYQTWKSAERFSSCFKGRDGRGELHKPYERLRMLQKKVNVRIRVVDQPISTVHMCIEATHLIDTDCLFAYYLFICLFTDIYLAVFIYSWFI